MQYRIDDQRTMMLQSRVASYPGEDRDMISSTPSALDVEKEEELCMGRDVLCKLDRSSTTDAASSAGDEGDAPSMDDGVELVGDGHAVGLVGGAAVCGAHGGAVAAGVVGLHDESTAAG